MRSATARTTRVGTVSRSGKARVPAWGLRRTPAPVGWRRLCRRPILRTAGRHGRQRSAGRGDGGLERQRVVERADGVAVVGAAVVQVDAVQHDVQVAEVVGDILRHSRSAWYVVGARGGRGEHQQQRSGEQRHGSCVLHVLLHIVVCRSHRRSMRTYRRMGAGITATGQARPATPQNRSAVNAIVRATTARSVTGTDSSGRWASRTSPGPNTTVGMPPRFVVRPRSQP